MSSFIDIDYTPIMLHTFRLPDRPNHAYWGWHMMDVYMKASQKELEELRAAGWHQVRHNAKRFWQDQPLNILGSQAPTLLFVSEGEESDRQNVDVSIWAHVDDLQHAQQYPVLLCNEVPAPPEGQMEPMLNQLYLFTHLQYLFNLTVGSHAVVATNDGRISVYHIDQLGDVGKNCWETMKKGLCDPGGGGALRRHRILTTTSLAQVNILDHQRTINTIAVEWRAGQEAALQLVELYWNLHQTATHLSATGELSSIPAVFVGGAAVAFPNALAIQGVLTAYSNAQSGAAAWTITEQEASYIYKKAKDVTRVELRPSSPPSGAGVTLQSLFERVSRFNDYDGDVFLAMLAQWMSSKDADGYTWISSKQILNYRGIQPHKYEGTAGVIHQAEHRYDDLRAIAESVSRVRDTHVTIQQWAQEPPTGKRGRRKKQTIERQSYVLTINEFLQQRDLGIEDASNNLALAWRYKPGSCLESFLDESQDHSVWLLKQALSYDPYRELWEKRLARHFMFQFGQEQAGTLTINQIGTLIEELSLPLDRRNPERTRARFEQAMTRLQNDGMIASWDYTEDQELPGRRWLDLWLQLYIHVTNTPVAHPPQRTRKERKPR